jgi:hypothetical protein
MEIHTAEPLVTEHSTFQAETAFPNLKSIRSAGSDQIPA